MRPQNHFIVIYVCWYVFSNYSNKSRGLIARARANPNMLPWGLGRVWRLRSVGPETLFASTSVTCDSREDIRTLSDL